MEHNAQLDYDISRMTDLLHIFDSLLTWLFSIGETSLNWIYSILVANPIALAILTGFITFWFALRSQRNNLRNESNMEIYKEFRKDKRRFSEAAINYSTHLMPGSVFIGLESIESSRQLLKGIGDKQDYEYESDMRQRWNEYAAKHGEYMSALSGAFVKFHQTFEETEYAYPELRSAFYSFRDEYQKWFEKAFEIIKILHDYDGVRLLDKDKQKELEKRLTDAKIADDTLGLQVYSDDFLKLVQKELLGNLYKYKFKERVPIDGSPILTKNGWKRLPVKKENPSDKKQT